VVVLGVDPSTVATGWGVVDGDSRSARAVSFGVIRASTRAPLDQRLRVIHERIVEIIADVRPRILVIESPFFAKNARTAFALGQVRGVVLLAAAQHEVPFTEYAAMEIKRSAVGYGAADKSQVVMMMSRILGVHEPLPEDAADALAAAWCHVCRDVRPALTRSVLGVRET
jgi:crossover junction endodeoxyribonuclease RuvC